MFQERASVALFCVLLGAFDGRLEDGACSGKGCGGVVLKRGSLELVGPALLLGPDVGVGGSVLLENGKVGTSQLLLAEGADRSCLGLLYRSSIGVDGNASASSLSLLVLAVDTVLLGNRHLDCVSCLVWQKTGLAETTATKDC